MKKFLIPLIALVVLAPLAGCVAPYYGEYGYGYGYGDRYAPYGDGYSGYYSNYGYGGYGYGRAGVGYRDGRFSGYYDGYYR